MVMISLCTGTSSSSGKCQLASDPMLRRVSSTIRKPGVMLASTSPSPTAPSSLIFSPLAPSPTTPASLPSGVDTNSNGIKLSEVEPRPRHGILLYHSFYSPHSPRSLRSIATGCSTSGYTLDAATRLQHFRALIDALRATLLRTTLEFDTGSCDYDNYDYDEERERQLTV
jgi:hypothetical protein